jgi:hypothetical protein
MAKAKRAEVKRRFFEGEISLKQFKSLMDQTLQYKGFHFKTGQRPKWSGPFRDTREKADQDNAKYFDAGYKVDVYIEQK